MTGLGWLSPDELERQRAGGTIDDVLDVPSDLAQLAEHHYARFRAWRAVLGLQSVDHWLNGGS